MAGNKDIIDTIIAEAGGTGDAGITAAAWAIAQRAAARGQTMDEVIRSGFDGFSNPGSGSRAAQQDPKLRANVERILNGVTNGSIPNPVPGADHFLSGNANPSWVKGMTLVGTIGGQRYYASGNVPKSAQGQPRPTPPANIPAPMPATMSAAVNRSRLSTNPAVQATASLAAGGGTPFQIRDMTASTKGMFNYGELKNPNALVIHHTGGHPTVAGVIQTYKDRGLPAQFIIDREGNVVRAMSDTARGRHTKPSEDPNLDISNDNSWGVEIIANDDKDVTPAQRTAALGLTNYLHETYGMPTDRVVGHGHINGHKQADEGNSVIQALRASGVPVAAYASTGPIPPADVPNAVGTQLDVNPNAVTPAIRRPSLPTMGTPDVNSVYAGIYGQQPRVNSPQSGIDRGAPRIPPVQGNLTNPGAIDASVNGLAQNPALQAALTRSISSPNPAPQSQIERTRLPIPQSQVERTALPRNVPPDLISQSMQRIASANPTRLPPVQPSTIGQPPSTRTVQSVSMPASPSFVAEPRYIEPRNTQAPATPRITVSTPSTTPQRMAGQDDGNVPRITAPAEVRASVFAPAPVPSRLVGQDTVALPKFASPVNVPGTPNGTYMAGKTGERLKADPNGLSVAPVQTARIVAPAPSIKPVAFPSTPQLGTPQSGGLSRDAVALRARGTNTAQAMATTPRFLPTQAPIQVSEPQAPAFSAPQVNRQPLRIAITGAQPVAAPVVRPPPAPTLSPAALYAMLNRGSGSINNSDAASRVNGSNTRGSGGANSLMS